MKKCLSLLIALSMVLTMCVLPVSAETEVPAWVNLPDGANLIFAENFEEGFAEGNLLTQLDADGNISKTDGTKVLWFESKVPDDQTAEVVSGPEDFNTTKVLKLTNKNTTAANYLAQKIYLDNGDKVTRTANTQLVIEYDVMLAGARFGAADGTFMTYTAYASGRTNPPTMHSWGGIGIGMQNGNYIATATDPKSDWFVRPYANIDTKKTIKVVVEQDLDANFDSTRLYYNNKLLTGTASSKNTTDWNTGKTFKDFIGVATAFKVGNYESTATSGVYDKIEYLNEIDSLYTKLTSNGMDVATGKTAVTDPTTLYLDNIKVYEVPAINFTGLNKAEGVQLSEGVVVNFDQPFNATEDTFKVSAESADTWIEDAVTEVTLSSDKKSATVKFDVEKLPDDTEFKLWIDDEFTSAAGAIFYKDLDGVKAEEEYVELTSFATLVPLKVVEAPESIDGLIPNDPRAVEVEVSAAVASVEAELNETDLVTSYNGSTAKIFFANVAEPKSGVVNVKITGADDQVIDLAITATSVKDGFVEIYDDDLEGYEVGQLITDTTGKTFTNGNFEFNTSAASFAAAGTAEIIKEADGNKALKLKAAASGVDLSAIYKSADNPNIQGKVTVLKTKYYFPNGYTDVNGNEGAAASIAYKTKQTGVNNPDFRIRDNGGLGYNSGDWTHNYAETGWSLGTDKWIDIVTVVDEATEGTLTDPHTSRRYADSFDGKGYVIHYVECRDNTAGETKDDNKIIYDVAPKGYYGKWDFSAGLANPYKKTTSGFDGTPLVSTNVFPGTNLYGTYTDIKATANDYSYVMVDEYRAYIADKFEITSISENKDAFIPNRHTLKVVFNQPIDQAQADSVKLYTAAGEAVEGMTATVENGGYAIDFKLPLVDAGAYKLSIAPTFHDIQSFQGLGSKNKDYEIPVTVTEYVSFKAEVDNAAITGFTQGKTTKAVITLSAKTALVDSNVAAAFNVVNAKGETVEGMVADVADDQMSITLDFTNLPTADYTITSNANLVDADGFGLEGEAVEITITAKIDKIMLFEEDFETGYTLDEDWLDTAPANGKWTAGYSRGSAYANDSIKVVNTLPEDAVNAELSGNALHIWAEQEATKVTKGIAAKAVMDPIDIAATYPGKVLIMEADVYGVTIADGSKPIIASFNNNLAPGLDYYKHNGSGFKYEGTWFSMTTKSHTGAAYHMRWLKSLNTKDMKFVTVIDQRNDLDTVKLYGNGTILAEKSNTLITDHPLYQQTVYEFPLKKNNAASVDYWGSEPAGSFYGPIIVGQTYSSSAANTDMYIDNIKVYLVDAFEITTIEGASTAFNVAKDTLQFNFTNKVKSLDDAMANIKITDAAGADVAYTASLAEGGYQLVVDIDDNANGELKITVSPEIQDEFGQSLAHKYYDYDYTFTGTGTGYLVKHGKDKNLYDGKDYAWAPTQVAAEAIGGTVTEYTWEADGNGNVTMENPLATGTSETFTANGWVRDEKAMQLVTVIKTTKSTSLYAEATAATVDGTSVSTTLTFTNPEEETLPVWYIVAAYGQYNEMIGCKAAALEVAKGTLAPIDVNFTTTSSDIQSIKVYVWDGYKTMIPYQDAEEIK